MERLHSAGTAILFAAYYLRLRLGVTSGLHKTMHPLDIRWRWRHWRSQREMRRR